MLFALVLHASLAIAAQEARSLDECFHAAKKRSETVGTQADLIDQAEELYKQAKGALFPQISGVGVFLVQAEPPAATAAASLYPSSQTTLRINASQSLFRGFREYAGLRQRRLSADAQKAAWQNASSLLYNDVSTAYYNILSLERQLSDLREQREADLKRVSELKTRMRIGRSRETDALTVQTQVATLEAQIETLLGQIGTAREVLVFLTGFEKEVPLRGEGDLTHPTWTLDAYLKRIGDRPDVQQAEISLSSVEEGLPIARGGHLPSLDLSGDYFLKRPGSLSEVNWVVALTATIPIFAGFSVQSQVRQAASATHQAELGAELARRKAEQEIRTLFGNVQSDLLQVDRLSRAAELAVKTYQQQMKDFRLGLVTNLDVLQAESSAEVARRTLDTSRFTAKLDLVRLEVAAALRPEAPKPAAAN